MTPTAKRYITALMAIATLCGCSDGDNEPEINDGDISPRFTATIGDMTTRAFDEYWEPNDRIGISCGNISNVCHTTIKGDGDFSVENPDEQIYFSDEKEITFTAYYPWYTAENFTGYISADTRAQDDQNTLDFLWAKASGNKANPNVAFTFSHTMTKVNLTIKPGDGVFLDEIKTATMYLEGLRHRGRFNILTGNTRAYHDAEAEAGPWLFSDSPSTSDKESVTYSLILFPQTFTEPLTFTAQVEQGHRFSAKLDFTAANSKIDGDKAINEWAVGRQYDLRVKLNRAGAVIENTTISDWITEDFFPTASSE